ncbi:hypothetical protein GQ600_3045 [Phytophthora cactorum]|nr:hypothetical protein GQ600_3045 [Phytophthora cactorum]
MSISIHFTTTDRKGSSTVGSTTVDSTAAALKSFRYDALIRIASKVGLTMPNIFSSSVPGRGPVMSSSGKLESGFEFFRSMYVVAAPELENFFQRTRSIVLALGVDERVGDVHELDAVFGRELQLSEGIDSETFVAHFDTLATLVVSAQV